MKTQKPAQTVKTVADLARAAKVFGGYLTNDSAGKWTSYRVEAPDGMVWACAALHALKVEWMNNIPTKELQAWRTSAIEDAIDRISYGVEKCEDPDCDYCHPE